MTWELAGASVAVFYVFFVMPALAILSTVAVLSWLLSFIPTSTRIETTREFYSDRR